MAVGFELKGRGILFFALAIAIFLASGIARAQMPAGVAAGSGGSAAKTELPDPLTKDVVRDLVAGLSDAEVRNLLLERLDAVADEQTKSAKKADALSALTEMATQFYDHIKKTVFNAPLIAPSIAASYDQFRNGRSGGLVFLFLVLTAAAIAVGVAAAYWVHRRLSGIRHKVATATPESLRAKIGVLMQRIGCDLLVLVTFTAVAIVVAGILFRNSPGDRFTAVTLIGGAALVWLAATVTRFLLAPSRPELRLCYTDDDSAKFMHLLTIVVASLLVFGNLFFGWLVRFGMKPGVAYVGFWITLSIFLVLIWGIWRSRRGIPLILIGREGDVSAFGRKFAYAWPVVCIVLLVLEWLLIEMFVATGNLENLSLPAAVITLLTLVFLPALDTAIRSLVRELYPAEAVTDTGMQEARRETQLGLIRCARVVLAGFVVLFLARLWGLDLLSLAEQGFGARIAGALIGVVMILIVAYAVWEFINIVVNRQLAIERAEQDPDGHGQEVGGEGGGQGATRLGTLLPLLRRAAQTAIIILGALAILGEIGINITPLLAGAGIIGLAIGFGAQTLVRDIVSGLFFLIDDAFRIGEYIDVDGTIGTVERISIRSLRLRHHRGPLHTIPYGEIPKLTNYSRDWVIVKLKFKVPFETDINKVKKIFKQIGKDLLQDPEIGTDFIEPFKSQGVFDVDESGIVVRGKFMARPGKQFLIRREVFVRVQKAFEENGIEFARKQVMIHIPNLEEGATPTRPQLEQAAASAAETIIEEEEMADAAEPARS